MASVESHHGVRAFQSGEEPVLVTLRDTSVVGLLAAIDADDLPTGKTLNKPFLVLKPSDAVDLPDAVKDHIDSVFDQVVTKIVVVLVDAGEDTADTTEAAVGDSATKTGIHAFLKATSLGLPRPKLLMAPGLTTASAADGIASVSVGTAGSGYTDDTISVTVAGATTGTGAVLRAVLIDGAIDSIIVDKPGYGYDSPAVVTITDSGTGDDGVATATIGSVLNPVIAEAQGVAEKLRAMFYADGPDGTNAQAVTARQLCGSRRVFFSDPRVLKSIAGSPTPKPSSAIFAGLQAKQDKERGAVYPGSNMIINGIQGTNRPVEYGEEANYLNFNRVNTIINRGDGFRAWGVWTCAAETIWQFVNVVRVSDLVNESIEEAFIAFNDRPQTLGNLDLMVMSGTNALKGLENEGFLLPGSLFWLSDGQTPEDGAQGILKFGMRYEVPAPIVDVRITAYRNITIGYELLYSAVTGEVEIGATL